MAGKLNYLVSVLGLVGLVIAVGIFVFMNLSMSDSFPAGARSEDQKLFKRVGEYEYDDNVLVLHDNNFDKFMEEQQFSLIKFYAPWCGHCKHLAPEYDKAAQILANDSTKVILTEIDATQEKELAERFKIQGFPTLLYYIKGEYLEYDGGRTEKEIVDWVRKRTVETAKFASANEVQKAKQANEMVAVLYTNDATVVNKVWKMFTTVSIIYSEIIFVWTQPTGTYKENDFVFYRNFSSEPAKLNTSEIVVKDIQSFLNKYQLPNPIPFSRKGIRAVFEPKLPVILLLTNNSKEAEVVFKKAVDSMKSANVTFSSTYKGGDEFLPRLLDHFGIDTKAVPGVVCFGGEDHDKKFIMQGPVTEANIKQFVSDIESGKIKPTLKSEPIPETQNSVVKKIVGLSFQDEVIKIPQDVILKVYAPWCHHC